MSDEANQAHTLLNSLGIPNVDASDKCDGVETIRRLWGAAKSVPKSRPDHNRSNQRPATSIPLARNLVHPSVVQH